MHKTVLRYWFKESVALPCGQEKFTSTFTVFRLLRTIHKQMKWNPKLITLMTGNGFRRAWWPIKYSVREGPNEKSCAPSNFTLLYNDHLLELNRVGLTLWFLQFPTLHHAYPDPFPEKNGKYNQYGIRNKNSEPYRILECPNCKDLYKTLHIKHNGNSIQNTFQSLFSQREDWSWSYPWGDGM